MPRVTVAFDDGTIESLDDVAASDFGGDREAAARALLSEWLERRPSNCDG